jgi:hypothetical protein
VLLVEGEDSRGSIVRRDVIRCATEGRGTLAVGDRSHVRILEGVERGKPSSQDRTHVTTSRDAEKAIALTQLAVLVSASCNEHIIQVRSMQIERHDVDLVIRVDEQGDAVAAARGREHVETGDDLGCLKEDARHHHTRGVRIEQRNHALDKRIGGSRCHIDGNYAFLRQPIDLPADAVELTVGSDDARTFEKRQRREPSRHQFMGVLSESDVVSPVTDESREAGANGGSLRGRSLPLVVDELRGIEPRTLLRREADIRPRLM